MPDVNLIPPERLVQKHRKARLSRWAAICGAYLAILSFALSVAYFLCGGIPTSVADSLRSTTDKIKEYNQSMIDLRKDLATGRVRLQTVRAIQCQPDWSTLLRAISEAMDQDMVLDKCRLVTLDPNNRDLLDRSSDKAAPQYAGAILGDRRYDLKISGFSLTQSSVSLFVLRLEQLGIFESVRLAKSRKQAFLGGLATAFSIECRIRTG